MVKRKLDISGKTWPVLQPSSHITTMKLAKIAYYFQALANRDDTEVSIIMIL